MGTLNKLGNQKNNKQDLNLSLNKKPKTPPIIISELDPSQRSKILEAILMQRASIHSIGGGNYSTTIKLKIKAEEPKLARSADYSKHTYYFFHSILLSSVDPQE